MQFLHDPFCRGVLSDVPTFIELVRYLAKVDSELENILNLLDFATFKRVPGDFSDTETHGYADLVFFANVKDELLSTPAKPIQVCVGFLVEHKSSRADDVMDQLRKYHYHLMVEKLKANADNGIPSIAIILYNGKEAWNPLQKLGNYPKELRRYLLPFKCVMLDVKDIPDSDLDEMSVRLAAFFCALKYIRDPEKSRESFEKVMRRIDGALPPKEALDLLHQIDVYLGGWLKANFKEVFKMDFVRPNYKTVGDACFEDGEKAGIHHQAEKTARRMLTESEPMRKIVAYSGLTEERIRELQKSMA